MRFPSTKSWIRVSIAGILLTLLLLWHPISNLTAHAQIDASTSFRLSRIETDIRTLRSEIQQLETSLERVARRSGETLIIHPDTPVVSPENRASGTYDPLDRDAGQSELMFDQLATLVIETRQDMFVLQEKVEKLEQEN